MTMDKDTLLVQMAEVKAEIQSFQLWVDDARTNRIARIRYGEVKERLKELVKQEERFFKVNGLNFIVRGNRNFI